MNKRGDSQIDWVISMGIFILYLAWFFIFIRPYMLQEQTPNSVQMVRGNFEKDAYWTVEKIPIIVNSQKYLYREPIIVDISQKYDESNSHMQNSAFIVRNNRLFFIGDVNLSGIFYLVSSNESYMMYNQITDLTATEQYATVTDFNADFENSMLKSAFYFGIKIRSFLVNINGQQVNASNTSFSNKKIAAEYSLNTEALNMETYVFAYNPRIYMFFSTNKSIYQDFELDEYLGYLFDSSDTGEIHYPGECHDKNKDRLLFYDNSSNILFLFDKNVSFKFCSKNTSIELEINFDNSAEERIIFFRGDYNNYTDYINNYYAEAGVSEQITLPSLAKIQSLAAADYSSLKYGWGIADFRILVKNSSNEQIISEIGPQPYEKATVYAEEARNYLLDRYGNLQDIKISCQSWS